MTYFTFQLKLLKLNYQETIPSKFLLTSFFSDIITTKTFWRKSRGNATLTNSTSTPSPWPVEPSSHRPLPTRNFQNFLEFSRRSCRQSQKSIQQRRVEVGSVPKPARPDLLQHRDPSHTRPSSTLPFLLLRVPSSLRYPSLRYRSTRLPHFVGLIHPQRFRPLRPTLISGHPLNLKLKNNNNNNTTTSCRLKTTTNYLLTFQRRSLTTFGALHKLRSSTPALLCINSVQTSLSFTNPTAGRRKVGRRRLTVNPFHSCHRRLLRRLNREELTADRSATRTATTTTTKCSSRLEAETDRWASNIREAAQSRPTCTFSRKPLRPKVLSVLLNEKWSNLNVENQLFSMRCVVFYAYFFIYNLFNL